MQAPALDAFIAAGAATTTRLEPINSVKRVIEDHIGFQGYSSNGSTVSPTNTTGLFNLTATNATAAKLALDSNVVPFSLADVALYVITDGAGDTGDVLYTANPFTGGSPWTKVSPDGGEVSGGQQRRAGHRHALRRVAVRLRPSGQRRQRRRPPGADQSRKRDRLPTQATTTSRIAIRRPTMGSTTRTTAPGSTTWRPPMTSMR